MRVCWPRLATRVSHAPSLLPLSPRVYANARSGPLAPQYQNSRNLESRDTSKAKLSIRSYSAAATPEAVPVDVVLRKFYKLVHPDLFAGPGNERKREVNSESLAKLNAYLDLIKSGARQEENHAHRFDLIFYLRGGTQTANISVTAPDSEQSQQQKQQHMHRTLVRVFEACGFDYPAFTVGHYGSKETSIKERWAREGDVTLVHFLLSSIKLRQNAKSKNAAAQASLKELQKLSSELSRNHGIAAFAFDVPQHTFIPSHHRTRLRLNLLNALAKELERHEGIRERLKGAHVVFGARSQIDPRGRIMLSVLDDGLSWSRLLAETTPEQRARSVRDAKALADMEVLAAKALRVKAVYLDPEMAESALQSPAYASLLLSLAQEGDRARLAEHKDVRLMVSNTHDVHALPTMCTLRVPLGSVARDLVRSLPSALGAVTDMYGKVKRLTEQVKEQYALSALTYAPPPTLTDEQATECLIRLSRNYSLLAPYMNGLRLHIAADYGYAAEHDVLSIRWDFLLRQSH